MHYLHGTTGATMIGMSRKFTSDSLWSLTGNLVSIAAGLTTIKVITSWVEAEHFGQASLLLGAVALMNGLIVGPLMVVHLRLYFDYFAKGMGPWYASAFRQVLFFVGVGLLLAYLTFSLFSAWGGDSLYLRHLPAIAVLLFAQPYFSALSNYLEANRNQKRLAILNSLHRGLQPGFLLLLLAASIPQVDALLLAQGVALGALLLIFRIPEATWRGDTAPAQGTEDWSVLARSAVRFGWTLPLTFVAMWLLTTADRYIIGHFMTSADVGRYAMNYGFWSMPFLFLNGWLEILTRPLIFEAAAREDWRGVKDMIGKRLAFGMLASLLGTALLLVLAQPIAEVMLQAEYWVGIELVMAIAAAHCFFVLGYSIVPIFLATKNVNMVLIATLIAGIFNIVINLWAVPVYGLIGAAVSTLLSYVLWAVILAIAAYNTANHLSAKALAFR